MCKIKETKLEYIKRRLFQCEVNSAKIKAFNFVNLQSFDTVYENYMVGEPYIIDDIGYSIVTSKSKKKIEFVVIMKSDAIWMEHWQDVDKHIDIKQGIYLDMYTGKEYTDELEVKAFEPSYFKAIGKHDLIIKGKIFR